MRQPATLGDVLVALFAAVILIIVDTLAIARLQDRVYGLEDRVEALSVMAAAPAPTPILVPATLPDLSTTTDAGEEGVREPVATAATAAAEVVSSSSGSVSAAALSPSAWGEQLSREQVHDLAFTVTGDEAWSSFAARCFTDGRENRGYVGIIGGPNPDGSYDHGLPQINDVHAGTVDLARVRRDPAYALEAAYGIYVQQGYGAWDGCR